MSTKLIPHTFKDTGITVQIRKVSPYLILELRRTFPEPLPPVQRVNYGTEDQPEWREEANPASPEYLRDLIAYRQEFEAKLRRLVIKRGVICDVDAEAVKELREFWKDSYGVDLPEPDDKIAYVSYICVGSNEDLDDLQREITRRSEPVKEDVDLAKASFQDQISGDGHLEEVRSK